MTTWIWWGDRNPPAGRLRVNHLSVTSTTSHFCSNRPASPKGCTRDKLCQPNFAYSSWVALPIALFQHGGLLLHFVPFWGWSNPHKRYAITYFTFAALLHQPELRLTRWLKRFLGNRVLLLCSESSQKHAHQMCSAGRLSFCVPTHLWFMRM